MVKPPIFLVLLMIGIAALFGCSSDDDPAGPGNTDAIAPGVVSITPGLDDTNVASDEDIVIVFSEAMDAASATGQVTLSAGTVTDLVWDDDLTLRIEHTSWTPGSRVDVTLGTGITDVAGNGIALAYASGFWVSSGDVLLLATDPADGATGVIRNAVVSLTFNRPMNLTTLEAATTVDDGVAARVPVEFEVSPGEDTQVLMSFPTALEANTTISVTIGTGATSQQGESLASEESFSFTTGSDSDTTPPTLVSIVPSNGSTISPNTSSIVFTFSEGIDDQRFAPTEISGQLIALLDVSGIEPTWSANGTVLTVPLPTPLPAGTPLSVVFEEFFDTVGNVSVAAIDYEVTVSGTPQPWPFVDDATRVWSGTETQTVGTDPPQVFSYMYVAQLADQGDGTWHANKLFEPFTEVEDFEIFQPMSSQLSFVGFTESDMDTTVVVSLVPAVKWLELPLGDTASWSGSSSAPMAEGTGVIDYSVQVLGREDVNSSVAFARATVVWKNCWQVQLQFELGDGETTFQTGTETTWYAPGFGPVRIESVENDLDRDRVSESSETLFGFQLVQ